MTVKEVQELMRNLELVYSVVRLVDPDGTAVWSIAEDGTLIPGECCFSVWGKSCRCENCSSMRACKGQTTVDKYEVFDTEAFHITSKYIEMEGRGFVLEIVSRFTERNRLFLLADEEKRRRHIIELLAEDFECVHYIDLKAEEEANEITAYRISDALSRMIPGWAHEHCFRRKTELAAEYAVIPEDRDLFLSQARRENILSHLIKEDIYFIDFRMNIAGTVNDYQMKFHADRDEKGELIGFVVGLHSIASETRNSLSYKKSAIDSIKDVVMAAFWYEELYENGRLKALYFSDEMRAMLGYRPDEFPDSLDTLLEHIHPDDRQLMLDAVIAAGTG